MRHWVAILIMIAAIIIASALLVEGAFGDPVASAARRLMAKPGAVAALAVVGILCVDIFVPIPSSLVMISSGAVFGVGPGALLSLIGSLSGNVLGFELARRYGRGLAERLVGRDQVDRMGRVFTRYGAVAVILSRPVPVIMETLSLVAGLARMRRTTFLSTSLLGTIPACLLYAYAGAFSRNAGTLLPAFFAAVALPAVGWGLWQLSISPRR